MTTTNKPEKDEQSYSEAIEELQQILNELESENVDIDRLVSQVEQARILINFCQTRLVATEVKIEKIIETLDENS
tara:strand:- start:273 stop:497 length:225 start_codon:yes stop_codon:yes gene_type:complete